MIISSSIRKLTPSLHLPRQKQPLSSSCRDCYKCVRHCPVKAIQVNGNHAQVVAKRCIADGRCTLVCPQAAKKVESAIETVDQFLNYHHKVAVSLAPTFVAAFGWETGKVVAALKKMGFSYVEETVEGAEWVANAHLKWLERSSSPVITSCCPTVVNLIEIYYPELLTYLAPVISPMIAHGRLLKKRYGKECKVVFIGPCIAKKGEKLEPDIDAVMTFKELLVMLHAAKINPESLEASDFDGPGAPRSHAFPAPGGLARTVSLSTDLLAKTIISIDGLDETIAFLDEFVTIQDKFRLIELLACRGGCIGGPGMTSEAGVYGRRERLLSYAQQKQQDVSDSLEEHAESLNLERIYKVRAVNEDEPTAKQIQEILSRTGKYQIQDELNCGACGYNSCREKALAVAKGLAEVDMCIPFMRAKAESRAGLIFEMSPNAIFVVDKQLRLLEANPAARQKFMLGQVYENVNLQTFFDPRYFQEALETKQIISGEVNYSAYNLVAWQSIVYLEQEEVLIGIFSDITKEKQQREKFDRVTEETLEKAQEVINKQMRVAQEIAGLLGETTAETKVQLTKLMRLIQNETEKGR